jgi:starvation-inducible DNA-binding protein
MKTTDSSPLFTGKDLEKLSAALQGSLTDLIALGLVTKQCHWNVQGPNFRPLHLHLDEIYAAAQLGVDDIAERLVTIGISASGQGAEVAKDNKVPQVPLGFLKDHDVVELMTARLGVTIEEMRKRMDSIEEVDTVTADLMHGVVMELEKHHWMMRRQR